VKLEILKSLNEERAQRRAVVLVTNTESGEQRLVKAADVGTDQLKAYLEKRIRMGKSGMEETPQGRLFFTVHVPSPQLVITGAVHISQALAPIGKLARAVAAARHHRRGPHLAGAGADREIARL
jgi:xanthine dehydrogenase accessory factor